jgi:acyl carrier protein
MLDRDEVLTKVRAALVDVLEKDIDVRPDHHLVEDFGVDSVNIASLTIALEDQFDDILLLNDWIATANDPRDLTVGSLVDYLIELLSEPG